MGVCVGVKKRLAGRCANTTTKCHRICDTCACVLKGGGRREARELDGYVDMRGGGGGEEGCMVVGVGVKKSHC